VRSHRICKYLDPGGRRGVRLDGDFGRVFGVQLARHDVLQVTNDLVRWVGGFASDWLIPMPSLRIILRQLPLEHVFDIFADDGQELPRVERATGRNVEAVAVGVRRDEEIVRWRRCVPITECVSKTMLIGRQGKLRRGIGLTTGARNCSLEESGKVDDDLNLPAHAVRVNLDVRDLLPVKTVHGASCTGLEVFDVVLVRPHIEHGPARDDRHLSPCSFEGLHVGEAHVAVELDGAVLEYRHALACCTQVSNQFACRKD